jgi:predicted TIM-barrel fold metal-dependent hydrolase
MSIFDEPKIDCHVHVLDPWRVPYASDTHYRPAGQETGTFEQLAGVMDAYGTRHALIVGPNSGYGPDNRCLLDAIARSRGRCKGVAVVRNDASVDELEALKRAGIVGVAWNVTHYGVYYYDDAAPLLDRLRSLDLFVQLQVEHEQLIPLVPMLDRSGVRMLVDHAGRPTACSRQPARPRHGATTPTGSRAMRTDQASKRNSLLGVSHSTRRRWIGSGINLSMCFRSTP